mmetsp:Transcript_11670/g.35598  ORF Transcript_11670/g.35598 Transcript_11670/m.35598 type:complete len:355 (+) Transcript_11670:79-1143(+)|eukprot:CAMPEP_0198736066 /NCGR_PEP_ID=MMETSP1475-20131203/63294_1 /TAXON_ID= ORGANISM="Unidentified sp., Strain CCMP1999" /NCGR_SAMPLE_ID=MMETSP1475 /ASSEMBLY_ACC=CAM_ASM_001111 /LENGTH=354 /DNA_ID=CAMNT_0044499817 /DNA_START=65 /DNA_END=1129 /DNA_ORIENTATION=-
MSHNILGLSRFEEYSSQKREGREAGSSTLHMSKNYTENFNENSEELQNKRNETTSQGADKSLVQDFYSIATDLYEYGWGQSFHFGVLWKDGGFQDAIRRYEYYLPLRLKTSPGDKLLDLGCGVGGPMRNIARFSGTKITGVNISEYQVFRANKLSERAGLQDQCEAKVGDFTQLQFDKDSFDGVYAIEATCHTNDKCSVYSEAFRVLKPGGRFAAWEWVVTDAYDPTNEEHRQVRFGIEKGNGLPETVHYRTVLDALKKVGFVVEDAFDATERCEVPWWTVLSSTFSLQGMARTTIGFQVTNGLITICERLGLLPKGVSEAQKVLINGARNLVLGGQKGIYSTMYFFVARKPEE